MSQHYNLKYIGNIVALVGEGASLSFVTSHEERPTFLYSIDCEKHELQQTELPSSGRMLHRADTDFWIGTDDARLFTVKTTSTRKQLVPVPVRLETNAVAAANLSDQRVGLIAGHQLLILNQQHQVLQTLDFDSRLTSIASHPGGAWMVVGDAQGNAHVLQAESQEEFQLSESESLHRGQITSLLFEPEELRFFSAGQDHRLLCTHARGRLEPEDQGRNNNHNDLVTCMLLAGEKRLITGSADGSCKSWTRGSGVKPSSLPDLPAVLAIAKLVVHKRPVLAVAGRDASLRLFLLSAEGKFLNSIARYNDGYRRAKEMLQSKDLSQRGHALHELAEYDDSQSHSLLFKQIESDSDHKLRETACQLFVASSAPELVPQLKTLLSSADAPIRNLAFSTLESAPADDPLELYRLSIATGNVDVGLRSVAALEKTAVAKKVSLDIKSKCQHELCAGFDSEVPEISRAAFLALESLFDKSSPRASLLGLKSNRSDTKRIALIRLLQRNLLADFSALAGVRRALEDEDHATRQTAFLISLMSQPKLLAAVRARDVTLHRLVHELENESLEEFRVQAQLTESKSSGRSKSASKTKVPKAPKPAKFDLSAEEWDPLLSAISARQISTCLLGAQCLSALKDGRAFGILMQLSRERKPEVRRQVARSLEALADPRATDRLATMLGDPSLEVRDAAYTALVTIHQGEPLLAAQLGIDSASVEIRKRGLQQLVQLLGGKKTRKTTKSLEAAQTLLVRVLSDSQDEIRSEAFKTIFNGQLGGDHEKTLRLILTSLHADVRREVFNDLIGHKKEAWAVGMLLEMLNDPDTKLRRSVFGHFLDQQKSRSEKLEWLDAAIESEHDDVRKLACQTLAEYNTAPAQEILARAVDDESEELRKMALESLISSRHSDAIVRALGSRFTGVQLTAANALASQGDPRAKPVFLDVLKSEWPEKEEDRVEFVEKAKLAIQGLGLLGDPTTLETLLEFLTHPHEELHSVAAKAIFWLARPGDTERLLPFLQHPSTEVRYRMALAAAILGDPVASRLVLDDSTDNNLHRNEVLTTALTSEAASLQVVQRHLDHSSDEVANTTFLVLLFQDWLNPKPDDFRLITCLAAGNPRARWLGAQVVEKLASAPRADTFSEFAGFVFNHRGPEEDWSVPPETIEWIARSIVFGSPQLRVHALHLLDRLAASKQAGWELTSEFFVPSFSGRNPKGRNRASPTPIRRF